MTAAILAHVKTLVGELRDQARAAFSTAAGIEQKAVEPARRLSDMTVEETDLMEQEHNLTERLAAVRRRLETLRPEMLAVRQEYDALKAEHAHHAQIGEKAARTADYYERTTIPDVERILAAPPAPVEQPPAGPPPPPRDETALVPVPNDDMFNVIDSTGADWLKAGHPLVTATDVAAPEVDGPRHAKPPKRVDVSGAFKAITGRLVADEPPAISRKAGVHKAITPTSEQNGDRQ
ncbi:hypothetical protein [Actinomadura sediminis]|uniref:PspA/IM30 family protein n=1 Tax=Actinomadura sediminis TaxID=1038904 RepID=A0ABW3ET21_9ACTN